MIIPQIEILVGESVEQLMKQANEFLLEQSKELRAHNINCMHGHCSPPYKIGDTLHMTVNYQKYIETPSKLEGEI